MLKSQKFELTCSYCSKIFKDPILLPCGDFICREHLKEKNVVKENRIECTKCKKDFEVKENEFNTNVTLKKLVEDQSHLSGEEQKLKLELEDSIRPFFEFYEEFVQNRTQLESEAFDHFQEMHFKIDKHRERLKEKIDDIALNMIDATKKHEEMYLRNIKERFSSFDHFQSLQIKLNEIDETFRDPKLLIQSIREIQFTQEATLNDMKMKIYNFIIETNYHHRAVNCYSLCGPTFGQDIYIANNANTTMDNYSNLGYSYPNPQYEYETDEAQTFLAGS